MQNVISISIRLSSTWKRVFLFWCLYIHKVSFTAIWRCKEPCEPSESNVTSTVQWSGVFPNVLISASGQACSQSCTDLMVWPPPKTSAVDQSTALNPLTRIIPVSDNLHNDCCGFISRSSLFITINTKVSELISSLFTYKQSNLNQVPSRCRCLIVFVVIVVNP